MFALLKSSMVGQNGKESKGGGFRSGQMNKSSSPTGADSFFFSFFSCIYILFLLLVW